MVKVSWYVTKRNYPDHIGVSTLSDTIIENDILHGVAKIAEYMKQLGFEMPVRRCFDWVAAGRIPHTKVGVGIISSKSAIRERFIEAIK
jgi:hypothetical protein